MAKSAIKLERNRPGELFKQPPALRETIELTKEMLDKNPEILREIDPDTAKMIKEFWGIE